MVAIRHSTTAAGTNNPNKQVSVTAWNDDHTLSGTADTVLGFDNEGIATEKTVPEVAAARSDMAALSASAGKAAFLRESGREGTFVFDSSDLSAKVAIDAHQGIYVPPASDLTGASGAWVRQHDGNHDPRWFGAAADGATDDVVPIQAALDHVNSTGGGTVRMTPGKTFKISAPLSMQNMIDVEINAHGATITSAMTTSGPMVTLYDTLGKRCHIRGGLWKLTGGSGNPWFFSFAAPNCTLEGVHCIKTPDAGGYHMYVFNTAPGFKAIGNRFEGSNGIYIETSDALFLGNSLIGQVSGGDDCFAVKGLNSSSRNLRFIGNYIEALSNGLAIGSEIGVLGANDATYSRSVGQIVFVGNTLKECSGVVSIKPGAIAGADYRDGTVEDVVISNNTLIDESGARFVRGISFYAGKGGRIRNVFGRNNTIRARALTATGRVAAIDFYVVSDAGGTAEAAISNVDLEIAFTDPYGGVANDVSHPGYPVNSIVQAELADTSIGSMSNISLSVAGDGCTLSGIDIGASLDDAFTISRASLTNINNNLSSAQGGIRASSRMTVGTDISISVVGGQPYRIESTGEILCPELEQQVFLYTQVNAGNADTQYPWVAKRRCLLTELKLGTTLSIAQSDTNYTSLTIRNLGSTGNVFNTAETKATGSSGGANPLFSLTAQQYSTIFLYRTNLSTESKFARGSVLMMSKADTGAGATLQNARMIVRALPY